MKNFLSTAFVAVMLMLASQAQAQIKFGVKGGLTAMFSTSQTAKASTLALQ